MNRTRNFMLRKYATYAMNLMNDKHITAAIEIGTDVFNSFTSYKEKPSAWNLMKGLFLTSSALLDRYTMYPHDYFNDSDEWSQPFSDDFSQLICHVFRGYPFSTIKCSAKQNAVIKIVDLDDDCKIGYVELDKFPDAYKTIYVHVKNLEKTKKKVNMKLWEQFKDKSLVLRSAFDRQTRSYCRVAFESDDLFVPLPSKRALDYSQYLKRCLDANVARSVMLYGPPGTGKSTMACTIVNQLNLRSFRLRVGDLERIQNTTLFDALSIFVPDAVILDDFDRARNQDELLEMLEYFQKHVKLIIATVNDKRELDQAILRPGRFDELVSVRKLDEEVIKRVLGENNQDAFEIVKEWPIAFVHELVKRRRFMNKDASIETVAELKKRVERLKEYDDDDDGSKQIAKIGKKIRYKTGSRNLLKEVEETKRRR